MSLGWSVSGHDTVGSLLKRERLENFPVALRILPRRHREGLHAVYAFARAVDELGDSAVGNRTELLHALDATLEPTWAGEPVADPVLARLQRTVVARGRPLAPFRDLVRANLQDQVVFRYQTFEELLAYCRLSAVPVGRIVLDLFDQADPHTVARSDQVCTALQLLEHWQDVGEDRRSGRVYLPQCDLGHYEVCESELDSGRASSRLRALMRFEIDRAAGLLAEGTPIVPALHGWARPCVAGFVAGGQATVAALRRTQGDVLKRTAGPSRSGTMMRLVALLVAPTRGGTP